MLGGLMLWLILSVQMNSNKWNDEQDAFHSGMLHDALIRINSHYPVPKLKSKSRQAMRQADIPPVLKAAMRFNRSTSF